jgi:hypothetical protein
VLRPVLRCYGNRERGCKKWVGDGDDRVHWWGFWESVGVLWDLITSCQIGDVFSENYINLLLYFSFVDC